MRSKNSSRGQKRSFIEQARRGQIIEAAIAELAESGYAGTSLAKVAERAGISKGVVLYHFADKDELLETTVSQIYEEIGGFIGPRIKDETTARGRLRAYIESEFAFLEKNRARLLAIANILANHRDRRGELSLRDQSEKQYLEMIVPVLEEGQKRGEFRTFALRPMAVIIMHAVNGTLGHWAMDPSLPLTDYATELANTFDLATRKASFPKNKKRS